MKLNFLGVYSALNIGLNQFQSNMLLETNHANKMLIDCGTDIRHALLAQKLSHNDIEAVYISHLHADHVGGLEWFAFCKLFIEQKRPILWISPDMRKKLWLNVLSGGMSSLETKQARLSTFFHVAKIHQQSFTWQNHNFNLIKVPHTWSNYKQLPSYGLIIHGDKQTIFITTDTRFAPEILLPVYTKVDLIFHDCDTAANANNQHASYADLATLDSKIKAKMWLYDYSSTTAKNPEHDGFLGFVKQGQTFVF